MPKTADKRADARRLARVRQAHQAAPAAPSRPATKRVPSAPRRTQRRSPLAIIRDYPWATTIFVLLVIGVTLLILRQQQAWIWAPKPQPVVKCDLKTHICTGTPKMTIDTHKVYTATIHTAKGDIVINLDTASAPKSVNNFVFLAQQGFYNGLPVSRVEKVGQNSPVTNKASDLALVQTGVGGKDGGPGFAMPNEPSTSGYVSGAVAMANGSQFFISTADNSKAITSTNFPIIGSVTKGLDVAQKLAQGDIIESVTITETNPTPTPAPSPTSTALPTSEPSSSPAATNTP